MYIPISEEISWPRKSRPSRQCVHSQLLSSDDGWWRRQLRKWVLLGESSTEQCWTFAHSATFQIDALKTALIEQARNTLTEKIQNQPSTNYKYFIAFFTEFYLATDMSVVTDPPVDFRSEPFQVFAGMEADNLKLQLEQIYNNFVLQLEMFCCQGSGHVISKFVKLEISTVVFDPTRSGSYIATPKKYANSRCGLLNP